MLTDKKIENIKRILGENRFKEEQGRFFVEPVETKTISDLIRLATQSKFSILPMGNGSIIDLSRIPDQKNIFLKLRSLSRVKKIVTEDLYVIVEAGLELKELNYKLSELNLFYPLSTDNYDGTVGGSVACGLSAKAGTNEVNTRNLVIALELVNSSGMVLKSGSEVFKSVTGYDTTRLLIGSWGTLGVITSVSLRVFPIGRKKEFQNLRIIPPSPLKLKDASNAKTILNRRIKKLLDPEGVFTELF